MNYSIQAQFVDIHTRSVYPAQVTVLDGMVSSIERIEQAPEVFILPGFIDAHVHIESSMLTPSEFARMAVVHGTVATVSDPHEIANVLGVKGVEFMLNDAAKSPFYFNFGAPSCVPATSFETAGAVLGVEEVSKLLERKEIKYLAEMMNWPGVLHQDPVVYAKLQAAKDRQKPIDGHAPGLKGEQAQAYAAAGISTDHECFSLEEAQGKAAIGMHILIREGSAAKNFEELIPIIKEYPKQVMFCCDDKHPDSLLIDHIDGHVRRAIAKGYELFDVLRAACLHPHQHYQLEHGLLRVGDPADFILVNNLQEVRVLATYLKGLKVAESGKSLLPREQCTPINAFEAYELKLEDFSLKANAPTKVRVVECLDGQLITNELHATLQPTNGELKSDTSQDVLKFTVVNRYQKAPPSLAFIKNFGLKHGALAGTVAHDSHNILAVGADDESLLLAVTTLMESKGGLVVVDGKQVHTLALPIAGLMSDADGWEVASAYTELDLRAKALGSPLRSPFMTLSFMALLVIPDLKLSDKGLFSGAKFEFTDLTY